VAHNTAYRGGGLRDDYGVTRVDNTTLSGNVAYYYGGGIFAYGGQVDLANATITANLGVMRAGGIWLRSETLYGMGSLSAVRSLIAGNEGPEASQIIVDQAGQVTADGFNLFGADGNAGIAGFTPGASDIVPPAGVSAADVVSPSLFPNGGPTLTHALPPGSPATDAAPSAACAGQTDQRGRPRNFNGDGVPSANECDIGAFERGNELTFDESAFLPSIVR
jgi:hypothetical protein